MQTGIFLAHLSTTEPSQSLKTAAIQALSANSAASQFILNVFKRGFLPLYVQVLAVVLVLTEPNSQFTAVPWQGVPKERYHF